MALKSIEHEWQDFAAKVIPTIAPESVQYREMKNSFFAGAFIVSAALEQIGANPNITEEQGVNYLDEIYRETMSHFKAIAKRDPQLN